MRIFLPLLFFTFSIFHAQENSNNASLGQLKIIINVDLNSYYLIIDKDYDKFITVNQDSIFTLSVGIHDFTIVSNKYRDYNFTVNIVEGITLTHDCNIMTELKDKNIYYGSSYPWIKSKINSEIYTDDDSEIFIDGKFLSKGPTLNDLSEGKHIIEAKNSFAETSVRNININSKQFQTILIYNKPEKTWAQLLGFFPGASQMYKGQNFRGYAYIGLTVTCIALAIKYHYSFINNNENYIEYKRFYNGSDSKPIIINGIIDYPVLINAMETQKYYDSAKNDAKMRDIFIYSTLGIYLINILDALFIEPAGGYRQSNEKNLMQGFSMNLGKSAIGINYSIKF